MNVKKNTIFEIDLFHNNEITEIYIRNLKPKWVSVPRQLSYLLVAVFSSPHQSIYQLVE